MRGIARVRGIGALALLWASLGTAPAGAAEAPVTWPTFFRLGPGKQYRVVDELPRGRVLDVLSCGDQWCQAQLGRTVGYVERAALEPPPPASTAATAAAPPRAASAPGQACFDSTRAGYGEGEQLRYCPR